MCRKTTIEIRLKVGNNSIFNKCDRIWEKGPYRANNDFAVRAFLVLPHLKTILGTKLLFLSQSYLPLFAYTHAKFERVEVLLKGQARCLKTAT